MSHPSELWTWEKCKSKAISLPGRNGYPDEPVIRLLGYNLDTESGNIVDSLNGEPVEPGSITYRSRSHTIFYVLSAYSDADDVEPTGKPITSKQMRGNHFVCRGYTGETVTLVNYFSSDPETLVKSAETLGGKQADFPVGDVAVSIPALPKVPITIALSLADDEFPAEARIYFDETIESYLDSEQTYFLTHLMVSRLIEAYKRQ